MSRSRNFSILGSACISLALLLTLGAAPQVPPPVNLVGHWKLEETMGTTAADAVGTQNGVYNGSSSSSPSVPPPLVNYPLAASRNFDGVDDFVSVPSSPSLQITGDITIAFWMNKAAEATDWVRVVGKGASGPRNYGVWEWSGARASIKFQQYNSGGGSVLEVDTVDGTLGANAWAHVVSTVAGTTGTVYINGAQSAQATRSAAPGTSTDPLTFGYAGFHTYYPGRLCDVRIYNRALSLPEIQLLHAGLPGPTGLTGTAPTANSVSLTWTAPAAGATSYTVKRSPTPGGPYGTIATNVMTTSYVDNTVLDDSDNYYRVTGMLSVGESAQSNEFFVRTPTLPPRFDDHTEGLFEDKCNCASTGAASPVGVAGALALLALALVALRR